jgi:hypothetical protein
MEKNKIILKGKYEDVIQENEHYYVIHKLDKICVLPYTISDKGLLDSIGVIKEIDPLQERENYVLINGFKNQDDPTNLVGANRLLFEIIGSNVTGADSWMYLGQINNTLNSNGLRVYCVNLTDVEINEAEEVEETKKASKFEMVKANKVVVSDDALFLAGYMRLFNFFYVNSLQNKV